MKKTQRFGDGAKDFEYNLETEHGRRLAEEAKAKADAKDSFKDEYKEHTMQISRDDINRLQAMIAKNPNVGRFKRLIEFMTGDKGFWTENLTLNIVDHDTEYDDYVNPHESRIDKIEELESQLKILKNVE